LKKFFPLQGKFEQKRILPQPWVQAAICMAHGFLLIFVHDECKKFVQRGDNLMLTNQYLYEKEVEMRHRKLHDEMEKSRLLAQLPKRPNMSRRAAGKLGVLLLKLGLWLKQLEHPQTVLEDRV
jgi:hypothetical protein